MFDKMVRCITRTGKAHRWLKPLALIALVLLFCGAFLTKWAVSRFARIRKTGGWLREPRRDDMEQREHRKERAGAAKPVRSFYRPAHRAAAVALSVCMVFTLMPSMAFAAEAETGLCEHHPEHTAECGYEPASPCEHTHDGDCYTDERICGFDEETEQTASGSDAGHTHTPDCYRLDCPHERGEHDESCGYSKGAPCTYSCELCNPPEAPSCLCDPQVAGEDGVHTNPDCPFYEKQAPSCLCDPQVAGEDGVHTNPDCPFYENQAPVCLCDPQVTEPDGVHTSPDCPFYAEPDEIDALCAAIDALPTVDELYETAPGNQDSEFDAWVAETRALLAEVPALQTRLLALAEDSAVMERITEERAGKLADLLDLAEKLKEAQPLDTTVVSIGDTPYDTLAAAIAAASSGDTLKITDTIDLGTKGVNIDGKDLTLDLNGMTVTYSEKGGGDTAAIRLINNASLTVTDTSTAASGKLESTSSGMAIRNMSTGTVTVSGGTVLATGQFGQAIYNSTGTVTVSSGTVLATGDYTTAINNYSTGTVTVSGGEVSATTGYAIWNASTGTVTVSGGEVSATTGNAIYNSDIGKITVSGGAEVTSANSSSASGTIYLARVPSSAQTVLNIQGGTVKNTADNGYAVYFAPNAVTADNLTDYYTAASGATVGRVHPEPAAITTLADLNTAISNANGTSETPTEITIAPEGITVDSAVIIDNKHIKLTGGTLTRAASYKNNLIEVKNGGSLTLQNITLDGNKANATGGCLINLNKAALVLEDGAVLTNNKGGSAINIGYHISDFSSITMNGGVISNNAADSGGAIKDSDMNTVITIKGGKITGNTATGTSSNSTYGGAIYSNGSLIIEGGEITGNSVPNGRGGGIFKTGGSDKVFTVTGGTISGNTARTDEYKGDNVYVNQCAFTLGGAANIPDGLYLKLGGSYSTFTIASALQNPVEIEAIDNHPAAGTLVASGASGYTITAEDLAKFSYKDGAFAFVLESNQIKLRAAGSTDPAATGGTIESGTDIETVKGYFGTDGATVEAASNDGVIKLQKDVTLSATVNFNDTGRNWTLDLNGHTLAGAQPTNATSSDTAMGVAPVTLTAGKLTVTSTAAGGTLRGGDGDDTYTNYGTGGTGGSALSMPDGSTGDLTLTDGNVTLRGGDCKTAKGTGGYGLDAWGGTVTLDGVTCKGGSGGATSGGGGSGIYLWMDVTVPAPINCTAESGATNGTTAAGLTCTATISISGGSYTGGWHGAYFSLGKQKTVTVTGGTFTGKTGLYTNSRGVTLQGGNFVASGDGSKAIATQGAPLTANSLLAEGYGYYIGDALQTVADDATSVGAANQTVTVKEKPAATPTPTVSGYNIYANGVPLILAAGSGDSTKTVIYIDKDGDGEVDAGEPIFDPDGDTATMNGTDAGNDLSSWTIYGGGTADVTGGTKITMTGGKVSNIYGGGYNANVTGAASVSITGGTVSFVYGGSYAINGTANVASTKVTVSGTAEVTDLYGGGYALATSTATANVTGAASVSITGGTVRTVYGGCIFVYGSGNPTATVGAGSSVTVGGTAKIGSADDEGVIINGGTEPVEDGVASFAINPDLADPASVYVVLPSGYDVTGTPTIATGAVQADLAKIKLTGSATGKEAYLDGTAIKVKTKPSATAPTITTTSLPDGTVGTAYSQTLAATGTASITWSVSAGSLPGGLTLNASTGVISGMPTTAGTSTFTVKAENSAGNATKQLSITIAAPAPAVTGVTVSPGTATVQKGTTQQFSATVTGTNSPAQTVTWSVTGGKTGTSITSGLLTVASDETAATLTVTATSTVDAAKSGTATVTVTDTPVTRYTLTVTNGTGGGSFEAGANVAITANAPANGKVFDQWTSADGVRFADANSAATTVTMPASDTAVTANYKDVSVDTSAIDAAIFAANEAKTGVATSDSPASSVSKGTKFVTAAQMQALNDAISAAQTAKGTVATAAEAQEAARTLNAAIATFKAAIKTGTYTSGSSGDSGSSGGSGGGNGNNNGGAATPPTDTGTTTDTTQAEVKADGQVDASGNVAATIPEKAVEDAIKKAEDEAKKNGTSNNGITLVLNVNTGGKAASSVTVNLPKVTQEMIIDKKIVNTVIVVDNPNIRVGMDLTAIREINRQAQADVNITAARMDNSKLTGDAKAAIGSRPVFDLSASYGTNRVQNFGAGTVCITIPYTLQKGEAAGGLYAVYVDSNGNVSYITNSSYDAQAGLLRFATNHFSVYGIGYKAPANFTDIADHWAKTDIEFAVNRGLMNGSSNTTFSPDGSMTRGMFVTALGRLAGVNTDGYKTGRFTDVKADAYYAPYVNWAAEKGIVSGTTTTTFAPDQAISRQEMAVIMSNYAKALGYKVPQTRTAVTFADHGSIGGWAADAVKQMQMAGILNGKDGNRFDPTGTATRAEVAAVLHRYVELVIDPATAQGLDVNDSGSAMLWENGKLVKSASRTVGTSAYSFNSFGEAALPVSDKKYRTHIVKKNEYFWAISRLYGCTMQELMDLNGLKMGDVIHPGDVLKVPQV